MQGLFLMMLIFQNVFLFYLGIYRKHFFLFEKLKKKIFRSCFQNSGQICLCTSRLYVQRGIYNEFLAKFIPEVKYIKIILYFYFFFCFFFALEN
jgi:hypothetical protein